MSNTTTRTRKAAASKADGSLNLATGELKVGAAKKTAAKKTTAKKATAKKAPATPDKPKKEQTFEERDWTYLDDKDPSEQHVILAREINRRTNLLDEDGEEMEISPKQVQAVLAMFPHFQRSETNKKRSGYKPLAEEIIHQRSVHMTLAHKEAREIMDGLAATANAKPAKKTATKKVAAKAPAKAATRKAVPSKRAAAKKSTPAPATTEAF
jgi:hypothetical protein